MQIKVPSEVRTFEQFIEWMKPKDDGRVILTYTKKGGKYCFGFSRNNRDSNKIDYLMSDGFSTGSCKIENLNKYLIFRI